MSELMTSLQSLLDMLIDSRNGYDEAVKRAAPGPAMELFREMIGLRTRHIGEIERQLTLAGAEFDGSGTLMSTVHRTVIDVRSMITGLDTASLASFADGEERIVKQYDQTIGIASGRSEMIAVLAAHLAAVGAKIDRMRTEAKAA
jgi:uncharacterized protein (TIGR02284 family)